MLVAAAQLAAINRHLESAPDGIARAEGSYLPVPGGQAKNGVSEQQVLSFFLKGEYTPVSEYKTGDGDHLMEGRQRSPSYPSTPLDEAIEIVRKIHLIERTNPVERGVAAKAMGYSGISGRSATILSNLSQYGLLEKAGKNEVRVTRRAVDILYPDTEDSKAAALHEAANQPDLFSAISERFPDGRPSEAAIEAFLIRQGYTHTAVRPATRAYLETFLFLENATGSESYSTSREAVAESQLNRRVERGPQMVAPTHSHHRPETLPLPAAKLPIPFGVQIKEDMIWLEGVIRNRVEAERVIKAINGLKEMLPEAAPDKTQTPAKQDDPDTLN